MAFRLGVISDTHGKLTPQAAGALAGVDRIVHGGDMGSVDVLLELQAIAPVTAVRGNCDLGETAYLPDHAVFDAGGVTGFVVHERPSPREVPPGARLIVFGHSHRALVTHAGDALWLNPGSASQGRGAPTSVAVVTVDDDGPRAEIVEV